MLVVVVDVVVTVVVVKVDCGAAPQHRGLSWKLPNMDDKKWDIPYDFGNLQKVTIIIMIYIYYICIDISIYIH